MVIYRLSTILLFINIIIVDTADIQCHSCFKHCKTLPNGTIDAEKCDCDETEKEQLCRGAVCFAKIEIFPAELTAIVQKGCASDIPGNIDGCQHAGHADSIHCYCSDVSHCNSRQHLHNYAIGQLPTIECCECSETNGDVCPTNNCLRTCTGNYCLLDFDGIEQGCGLGYPRLQNFLRTKNYLDWQGSITCARYQATLSTVVHGCTCTQPTGSCNRYNQTREFAIREVIERRLDRQNYCYSLHHKSKSTFGQEVFRKSDTCEGQYCFISLTTSELVVESAQFEETYDDHHEFVGESRARHELLAGCLKVDADSKVQLGCYVEYATNASDPLAKHCICETHLCNFYHLLSGDVDSRRRPPASSDDGEVSQQSPAPSDDAQMPVIQQRPAIIVNRRRTSTASIALPHEHMVLMLLITFAHRWL